MNHIHKKLAERAQANALRSLQQRHFTTDFYSNDYIGFSRNSAIAQRADEILAAYPFHNGATGSRLLLYDSYCHASIRDGISLSLAKSYKFRHNDLAHLEELLQRFATGEATVLIATESVFSMDGDSPHLPQLVALAERYGAYVAIDEAHALGVFGEYGSGLVQAEGLAHRVFARIVTYGKALGAHGAAVVASDEVVQYLLNFSRSFIYTTAMSPHSVALIRAGYEQLRSRTIFVTLGNNWNSGS